MEPKGIRSKKNVTLIVYEKEGRTAYKLLGPSGEVPAFTFFADSLKNCSLNTRKAYCRDLASFYDYFFEACTHIGDYDGKRNSLKKSELKKIIESWHDYLVLGEYSGIDLVKRVSKTLPPRLCSQNTSARKHSALRAFLNLSEILRREDAELAKLGLLDDDVKVDFAPLFDGINSGVPRTFHEINAIKKDSFFQSATKNHFGGLKLNKTIQTSEVLKYDSGKAFPLDLAFNFIAALTTYRDRALYALYAASGCRSNEALQLLVEDVVIDSKNPSNNKVLFIDPHRRLNHQSYRALDSVDRQRLGWKGRESEVGFLIEPFATLFFENLELYYTHEYFPHNRHTFLFQVLARDDARGKPYFLTAPTSRQDIFNSAARKAGIPKSVKGPHSFRHAFGSYLLNYFPGKDGRYGLPMATVRVMMGHKKIASTEKYATHDIDLINAQIHCANILIYQDGNFRSFVDQKLDAMRAQMADFERRSKNLSLEKRE